MILKQRRLLTIEIGKEPCQTNQKKPFLACVLDDVTARKFVNVLGAMCPPCTAAAIT